MGSSQRASQAASAHTSGARVAAVAEDEDRADFATQLGSEVAATLSSALERVTALAASGRIDRAGLRALHDEIERARRMGMMAQQLNRMASGHVRQVQEPIELTALLREALQQRQHEMEARGIETRQTLLPALVMGDATLTFALLQVLLDWSFEHARTRIDFSIDHKPWPAHARLVCSFAFQPADEVNSEPAPLEPPTLDTVSWRLLQQTVATLGLALARAQHHGRTHATLEFPATLGEAAPALAALDLDADAGGAGSGPGTASAATLAGSQVLVIAARREVRTLVRDTLRAMGLLVDFVTSVDEARAFCRGGMPHAVVHEAALGGEAFERLRRELLGDVPGLAFVQITEDGKTFEGRTHGEHTGTSVGRAAIHQSLPAALAFEITRHGR